MIFDPFGGADEAFFFRVPAADDDGALRLPARLEQGAEAVDRLEHGRGAGVGIDGAVDPGVAVIAGDDPVVFLGGVAAGDGADHVPDDAEPGVLLEVHVHLDRA